MGAFSPRESGLRTLFADVWETDKTSKAGRRAMTRESSSAGHRRLILQGIPTRKVHLEMTTQFQGGPRRLKAAIIGLGLDGQIDGPHRIITGDDCLMVGGSAETQADLLETMLRLEGELERIGRPLSEIEPAELADIAWRIDSPELHEIALRIEAGLQARGQTFRDTSAQELTDLAALGHVRS